MVRAHGFNSPLEEFSIAPDLARRGVPTTYPRAIHMSGLESTRSAIYAPDKRHFRISRALVMEHDAPLFRADHNYLTIWGYWNGSAEMTEDRDEAHVQPVDLGEAVARGLITTELRDELLERARQRLEAVGYRDLQLRAGHVLLSIRRDKSILLIRTPLFPSASATSS